MIDGLVALVTGAGSGLGAAISRRLAADGATVVVNDLRADAAEVVAKEVDGEAAPFDVSDSAAFDAAVDGVVARHGRIDIVVNNAGLLHDRPEVAERSMAALMTRMAGGAPEPVQALSTLSDELWDRMIKVHLYGTFHGMRAALRHMEPARAGAIVNVASIYGLRGSPSTPDYAAAKHGDRRPHEVGGHRGGAPRHPHQRRRPRLHRHAAAGAGAGRPGDPAAADPVRPPRPGRGGGGARALPRRTRGVVLLRRGPHPHRRLLMPTLFTRIIEGELPGRFVWRDDRCVAFLSIAPMHAGHTLVVPIAEVDHWIDVEPATAAHLMTVAQTIGQAQMAAFGTSRIGLLIAGLEVPHTHLHVVPIDAEADLRFDRADPSTSAEALDDAADRLRSALRDAGHEVP